MHIHKRMHIHTTHVFEVRSDESTLLRLAQTMLKCLCKLLQVLRAGTYSGITTSPVKAIRAQGLGRVTHQGSVAIGVKPVEGLFRFVFNLSKTTPPSDPVPADRCHEHHRCMWRPPHLRTFLLLFVCMSSAGREQDEPNQRGAARQRRPRHASARKAVTTFLRTHTMCLPPCCFLVIL
jgi:hypothetical protein